MQRTSKVVCVVGVLMAAGSALAGYKYGDGVFIDVTGRWAQGTFATTRATPDGMQYIGCSAYVHESGGQYGMCEARDAAGVSVYCYSTNPALMAQARAVPGDARLGFSWNESGTCTSIHFATGSYLAPKTP